MGRVREGTTCRMATLRSSGVTDLLDGAFRLPQAELPAGCKAAIRRNSRIACSRFCALLNAYLTRTVREPVRSSSSHLDPAPYPNQ